MDQVSVRELMNADPVTLPPGTALDEVTAAMCEHRYSCMVIADGATPVGIVTERDLVNYLNQLQSGERRVRDQVTARHVMSSPPVMIHEQASMYDALVLTQARKIRHLPVVDHRGVLTGILTYTDLAHAHNHMVEIQSDIIDRAVREQTANLKEANAQLQALSMEDALLEIGNRRAMEVDLNYTHNSAVRYRRPYSVVLYDVDCFKLYNDHYGHQAGDDALKAVARHLKTTVRSADRLYRYGGEEILLLLPETDIHGAKVLAGRNVEALAALKIPHVKSSHGVLTMSGGIGSHHCGEEACERGDVASWESVVKQADACLYEAKSRGRNQVVANADPVAA